MGKTSWTQETAARALSVKADTIIEAGERFGRPWAVTRDGGEYVLDGGTLKIYRKPLSEAERVGGQTEPNYDGMAIPRFIPKPEEADAIAAEIDAAMAKGADWTEGTKKEIAAWAAERGIETNPKDNKATLIASVQAALDAEPEQKPEVPDAS